MSRIIAYIKDSYSAEDMAQQSLPGCRKWPDYEVGSVRFGWHKSMLDLTCISGAPSICPDIDRLRICLEAF